ncbi:hypothetical protein [Selenihalanaerobacter shriftii]|uniref:Uncharacterized protein n=1 Tax=Selenihalanaerobacter shriftii TaxID=142842 RepID=A0A1T4JQL1_9FIRM|nr:hypothetical protein [Selenihalanaerobacter shriftii]SJZ32411.1 hypothetical protein SAMN02745118_00322 [Selenihalanaerobacter shriftii]
MSHKLLSRGLVIAIIITMLAFAVVGCASPQNTNDPNTTEDNTQDQAGDQAEAQQNNQQNQERIAELEEKLQLVTQDNSEGGCTAGCHQGEYNLQNQIKDIEGHPDVEASSLEECLQCHASGELAFKTVIHKSHLIEGEHYTEDYDKNCINCHNISEDGEITVDGLDNQENGNDANNTEDENNQG